MRFSAASAIAGRPILAEVRELAQQVRPLAR
jgi:hypothetical protein